MRQETYLCNELKFQPGLPSSSSASYCPIVPLVHCIPLIAELPPNTFPLSRLYAENILKRKKKLTLWSYASGLLQSGWSWPVPRLNRGNLKRQRNYFKVGKGSSLPKAVRRKCTDFPGSVIRGSPWPFLPDSMTNTVTFGFCVSLFAIVKPSYTGWIEYSNVVACIAHLPFHHPQSHSWKFYWLVRTDWLWFRMVELLPRRQD